MTSPVSDELTPAPVTPRRRLSRPRDGRWLGGVCAALADFSGRGVVPTRLAFVLAMPLFGIPVIVYLASWLILPDESPHASSRSSTLGGALVGLILVGAATLALLTLVAASATATVFGFGWGVVVVAVGVLAATSIWLRGAHPGWTLLPVLALVLPSAAMTAAHARLDRQIGTVRAAPVQVSALPAHGYRAGVGTLLIDLRHLRWPASGVVRLRVRAGVGRTIVALPHARCVAVRIRYDVHGFALRDLARAFGLIADGSEPLRIFGAGRPGGAGELSTRAPRRASRLELDYTAPAGVLDVRDYPGDIDPAEWADWPGETFPVPRPSVVGLSRRNARVQLADWRVEEHSERRIAAELPGPCARAGGADR